MSAEGVGRLFAVDKIANGPMPEHYEPVESPIDTNPFHPNVVTDQLYVSIKKIVNLLVQIKSIHL